MDSTQGSNLFIIGIVTLVLSVLITDDNKSTTAFAIDSLNNNLYAEHALSYCDSFPDSYSFCQNDN